MLHELLETNRDRLRNPTFYPLAACVSEPGRLLLLLKEITEDVLADLVPRLLFRMIANEVRGFQYHCFVHLFKRRLHTCIDDGRDVIDDEILVGPMYIEMYPNGMLTTVSFCMKTCLMFAVAHLLASPGVCVVIIVRTPLMLLLCCSTLFASTKRRIPWPADLRLLAALMQTSKSSA